MKTTIRVSEVLHEGAITGRHSGRILRESIVAALDRSPIVAVDLAGVDLLTQSAADEFIGRLVRQHADIFARLSFSNCSRDVAGMLQWAAEHANSAFQAEGDMVVA